MGVLRTDEEEVTLFLLVGWGLASCPLPGFSCEGEGLLRRHGVCPSPYPGTQPPRTGALSEWPLNEEMNLSQVF